MSRDVSPVLVVTPWDRRWGVKGAEEEEELLNRSGFTVARDIQGDVYYVGPMGHIIHLFRGNEWNSDRASREQSLEDYLGWIRDKLAALGERY